MKRATQILLIVVAVAAIVYDVWVYLEPAPGDTISEVLLEWATRWPGIAFAFGALGGHLFWPGKPGRSSAVKFAGLGVLLALAMVVSTLAGTLPLVAWMGIGVVLGHVLWPQTPKRS